MNAKIFFSNFKHAFLDFLNNPIMMAPAALLLISLIALTNISVKINKLFSDSNSIIITFWLIIFSLIYLSFISVFFSGLIGISKSIINGKSRVKILGKDFLSSAGKFWSKNLIIILITIIVYNIIRFISHYSAFFIGKFLDLSSAWAEVVFFLIYFTGLVGILIFFALSSFSLIIRNLSIKESIKNSTLFVKNNYPYVLSLLVFLFALNEILSRVVSSSALLDVINSIAVIPFISLLFSRFYLSEK